MIALFINQVHREVEKLLELRMQVAELLALGGAAGGVVLGVEIDDDRVPVMVGKLEGGAAGGWKLEVGKQFLGHGCFRLKARR